MCKHFVICMVLATFVGCKRNESSGGKAVAADTTRFFEAAEYIKSQIADVNSVPYFIYKIEITNDKKDSTPINIAAFNQLASRFLKPDINDKTIKPEYRENIFEDQSTNSFTISYSTLNKDLEIQGLDVLLKEDAKTVKRLFIRKYFNYPDSSAIEQLSWKPGEKFMINRAVQLSADKEIRREITVVWNEKR